MPRLKKAPDFIDPSGLETFRYWSDTKLKELIDGDTVDMHNRLGFHVGIESVRFRLARIQAPELRDDDRNYTAEGLQAAWYLFSLMSQHEWLTMQAIKTRKGWEKKGGFGRYLCELYTPEGININNQMVYDGYADWY